MFLRPYRPADKRYLQQLFFETVHAVQAQDYTEAQLAALAPEEPNRDLWANLDQQYCYIVEHQKLIVGFVSLGQDGILDFLHVHKEYQGRGIASTLLKQVERLARKKGIAAIHVKADASAKGFFEKNGFVTLSETKRILGTQEFQLWIQEKRLPMVASNLVSY